MTGQSRIDVGIIGGAGFTGRELLLLLTEHPHLSPRFVTSNLHAGKSVAEVFPLLEGKSELTFRGHEESPPPGIPLFLAVPNDTALALVPELHARGHRLVDLSGAFRLHDREIFQKFYRLEHTAFDLLPRVVYGMPELFRADIRSAAIISNPGCYATAAILPLFLLGRYREELIDIVIDAKSGVSGAGGRTEDAGYSFNSVHENFRAYKVLAHQHQPEIQEYAAAGTHIDFEIAFIPHLLPLFRGILSTTILTWRDRAPDGLESLFRQAAAGEPFLRFLNAPEEVTLSRVQHTNFLDIGIRSEGRRTIIVSALDNLVKGAAGQAIQNMNLIMGMPEEAGLHNTGKLE